MDENCRLAKERITEYVYNELPGNIKAEVEAHIASCEECRLEVEQQRRIISVFQDMKVDFTEDVWLMQRQMIMKKLEAGKKGFWETLWSNAAIRRLGYAFVILVFVGISTFAYVRHMLNEKEIVKNLDMYQNLEVIQQLDILEHIANTGDNT